MAPDLDSRADADRGQPCVVVELRSGWAERLAARLPASIRMPDGLVERLRWLFAAQVVLALAVTVPLAVSGPRPPVWPAVAMSSAMLVASWTVTYQRRTSPMVLALVDALALLLLATSCPQPMVLLPVIFAVLWFRSQYGPTRHGVVRVALFAAVTAAASLLAPIAPSRPGPVPLISLVWAVPTMLLMTLVGSYLAETVQARERTAFLEAVHAAVGSQLLETTDADRIKEIEWVAITQIAEASPGLRVLKVLADDGSLTVIRTLGRLALPPAELPEALREVLAHEGHLDASLRCPVLDAMAGEVCTWTYVSLPPVDEPWSGAWIIVGSPEGPPTEERVALRAITTQVTLALRNSAVHRELRLLAEVDGLTGLANRSSFNTALGRALAGGSEHETAVLFVDLDGFKDVNDAYGHQAGDELLRVVANRLQAAVRPGDLCARIGGDEFAVILQETAGPVAEEIAYRVVASISSTTRLGAGTVNVGASVGVATARGSDGLEALIHRADVAMYAAKAQGSTRVQVFRPDLLCPGATQMRFAPPSGA